MSHEGDDSQRDTGAAEELDAQGVEEILEQVASTDDEMSRRRLLAVLGGTAGAGAIMAAAPTVAGAEGALAAAKKAKQIGKPKDGANSLELLGRINQNGAQLNAFGYLTRITGLSDSKLFTEPRGIKFDDPDSTTPSTARFTFRASATIKALSATDKVITALGNGALNLYYQANGGAEFDDHGSFSSGKNIGKYKVAFQNNLVTSGPGAGGGPGPSPGGEATLYLTGKLNQNKASSFKVGGKKTVVGKKGLDLRLEALGNGELLDAGPPTSKMFIVGSLVAIA